MKNGGADERMERTRELLQSSVEGRGREGADLGASVVLGASAPEGAGGRGAGIWPLCLGFSVFAGARSRRSQLSVKRIPDTDLMASNEICALSRPCILKYK